MLSPFRFAFLTLSPLRFAGIITVIFAVCGFAMAQQIAPAGSGVTIDKVNIDNGIAHTVKYFVTGGSPQLQAMVRRVEWAENELSVVEQLQLLKLDTVVNERRVAAFRTAQLTNPYYPPGFIPISIGADIGGDGESPLQRALACQLASEATPQAALQMIGFLEQMQTELDAQLKALPPQEKKVVQGPIDALRPRVAALAGSDVSPARPQPVQPREISPPAQAVPQQLSFPAPAVPQQLPMPLNPIAFKEIEVEWGQRWWPAKIIQVQGTQYLIHYTGFNASWDEWVKKDRIRSPVAPVAAPVAAPQAVSQQLPMPPVMFPAPAAPRPLPTPLDQQVLAFQEMVRQNQEDVRQQIMQAQQQIMQRSQEIMQMHQMPILSFRR